MAYVAPKEMVAPLLFPSAMKVALHYAEQLTGTTFSGLNQAAAAIANLNGDEEFRKERNQVSEMLRHLQISTAMERHFTMNGSKRWVEKLFQRGERLGLDSQSLGVHIDDGAISL